MGQVNWIAVVVAALVASLLRGAWQGSRAASRPAADWALTFALMLLSATMIGHNFARIGADTLRARPWLYFMMSGGLALAFVAPALYLTSARHGATARERLRDGLFWIITYLAMGAVFWIAGLPRLTSMM